MTSAIVTDLIISKNTNVKFLRSDILEHMEFDISLHWLEETVSPQSTAIALSLSESRSQMDLKVFVDQPRWTPDLWFQAVLDPKPF
jgi:hypothetical protein